MMLDGSRVKTAQTDAPAAAAGEFIRKRLDLVSIDWWRIKESYGAAISFKLMEACMAAAAVVVKLDRSATAGLALLHLLSIDWVLLLLLANEVVRWMGWRYNNLAERWISGGACYITEVKANVGETLISETCLCVTRPEQKRE